MHGSSGMHPTTSRGIMGWVRGHVLEEDGPEGRFVIRAEPGGVSLWGATHFHPLLYGLSVLISQRPWLYTFALPLTVRSARRSTRACSSQGRRCGGDGSRQSLRPRGAGHAVAVVGGAPRVTSRAPGGSTRLCQRSMNTQGPRVRPERSVPSRSRLQR